MIVIAQPAPDGIGVADSGGVGVSWKSYGSRDRTVLFVPTWNIVDSRTLRHQVDGLRDDFRVITFDARGSGESGHPATGFDFSHHVADAVAVLGATGTTSAGVVTASRGASTALLLAARRPDLVERLALVAPALDLGSSDDENGFSAEADPEVDEFLLERDHYDGWELYSAPSWREDWPRFVSWFMAQVFTEPSSQDQIAELVDNALNADVEMLIRQEAEQDWSEAASVLASVTCPVLIVQGGADETQDARGAYELASRLPCADVVWLEGLGHRPDLRRPDLVNPLLRDFLADGS
jgi:pimeloyl-ACP methyl ester carboxylesterase